MLGTVGFWFPIDWPEAEIKRALAALAWGRGFSSEAARAVQKADIDYLPDTRLISLRHPENNRSINLALALGATYEKEAPYEDMMMHLYRHPAASPHKSPMYVAQAITICLTEPA